ncbi:MAG TPA: hypothetical protein DDW85_10245 [Porphyromonadaceae bacterium]|nr:hypothetical protein [Porphyromonadaceae bacterium]
MTGAGFNFNDVFYRLEVTMLIFYTAKGLSKTTKMLFLRRMRKNIIIFAAYVKNFIVGFGVINNLCF